VFLYYLCGLFLRYIIQKKNKKTDTIQTLLDKNLNIRLGDLKKKITEKLRKNKVSLQTDFIYDKTLSLVFSIYTDLSIFSSFPKLIKNRMLWEFRFKKKYFTPQSK